MARKRVKSGTATPGGRAFSLPDVSQQEVEAARTATQQQLFVPSTNRLPRIVLPDPELITILDQGTEGASVGFAVAAVLNYERAAGGDRRLVSVRMLYEFARLYDEWPGTDYEGSSLSGAAAGLWQHGVCLEEEWPYGLDTPRVEQPWTLGKDNRPAFARRLESSVEHLQAAVFEHRAVAVSGTIHAGWTNPDRGRIEFSQKAVSASQGSHAWAVIGYTPEGFLVQNSWGQAWGGVLIDSREFPGVAIWSYKDAEANLLDAWVLPLAVSRYRTPLVGYASDTVDGEDLLAIRAEVDAFSYVLASRAIKPPLALGLFGDWGSGKSFFMREMHARIASLTKPRNATMNSQFCRHIVQVRFNAWHYLDSDLWASLVTEIFDNLFESIGGETGKPEQKLPALEAELKSARGVYQQAKDQLEEARQTRNDAETALKKAISERELRESNLATQLNDLATLLRQDSELAKEVDSLASELGAPQLKASYLSFEAQATELKTIERRASSLWHSMFASRWGWIRVATLVAALFAPVLVVVAIEVARRKAGVTIENFHSFALQVTAFIGAVVTWLTALTKRGKTLLGRLEQTHEKLERIRARRREEVVKDEQQLANAQLAKEEAARKTLEEAEQRVWALQRDVDSLQPGKLIMRFIEERTKSSDYRSKLGIVSLIRRDFERLSELADPESKASNTSVMPVERIVLYIDDLDRCKPDRVIEVLEAIHLLLAFKLFMVVVAVDPRWLRHCLERHYPDLLSPRPGDATTVGRVPPSRPATAQDYLEKIFQIPFSLQPIRNDGYRRMIRGLMTGHIALEAPVPVGGSNADTAPGQERETSPHPAESGGQHTSAAEGGANKSENVSVASPEEVSIERLLLRSWELEDMQRLSPLFRSPRAVKRFINTYRFLRAGIRPHELSDFEGTRDSPGTSRAALLLLAIVVNYAHVGPHLLRRLRDVSDDEKTVSWADFLERIRGDSAEAPSVDSKTRPHRDAPNGVRAVLATSHQAPDWEAVEWRQLCDALIDMSHSEFEFEDIRNLQPWVRTVTRYSFSLSATATMTD